MYFLFQTELCDHSGVCRLISTEFQVMYGLESVRLLGGFLLRRHLPVFKPWAMYCTFLAFTTSTSDSTEPQATSAKPEEKKKHIRHISRDGEGGLHSPSIKEVDSR